MSCRGRCLVGLSLFLLVGATVATAANFRLLRHTLPDLHLLPSEAPGLLPVLVALLLLFLFLWARLEVDSGCSARWSGELDHLLQRQRQGFLRRAGQRIRVSTAHGRRQRSASGPGLQLLQAAISSPAEDMDRLVQKKRSGAWSPFSPQSGDPQKKKVGYDAK
jgi:hypothetical protein